MSILMVELSLRREAGVRAVDRPELGKKLLYQLALKF